MSRIVNIFILIEEWVTKILLVAVVCLVFFAALIRWVGFPIAWSVEMAQLLFIWLIFIGANQALRKNRHIGIDLLTIRLPSRVQKMLDFLIDLLIFVFLVVCVYFGTKHSVEHSLRSIQNLPLSYSLVTSAVPFGCGLMLLTLVAKWIKIFTSGSVDEASSSKLDSAI